MVIAIIIAMNLPVIIVWVNIDGWHLFDLYSDRIIIYMA